MAFATIALAELRFVFSTRSPHARAWRGPRNPVLVVSVVLSARSPPGRADAVGTQTEAVPHRGRARGKCGLGRIGRHLPRRQAWRRHTGRSAENEQPDGATRITEEGADRWRRRNK